MGRSTVCALIAMLITGHAAALPLPPVEECVRLALQRAPSAQAAEADLHAAQARVRAARAAAEAARQDAEAVRSETWPHLALNADGGFLGVDPGPTFRNDGGGQFLLGFNVPLFDGGAVAARSAAASAVHPSAQANVGQIRQTLAIALTRARADAQRARADAVAWQRAQPAVPTDRKTRSTCTA